MQLTDSRNSRLNIIAMCSMRESRKGDSESVFVTKTFRTYTDVPSGGVIEDPFLRMDARTLPRMSQGEARNCRTL
jgi:hypothetical protein